jgi:hypothetical protein
MRFLVGLVIGAAIGYGIAARGGVRGLLDRGRPAGDAEQEPTREQLYERAQAADIPGRSTMSKEELRVAVEEAERSASA